MAPLHRRESPKAAAAEYGLQPLQPGAGAFSSLRCLPQMDQPQADQERPADLYPGALHLLRRSSDAQGTGGLYRNHQPEMQKRPKTLETTAT